MEVKLKALGGSKDGQTFMVNQSKYIIGRADDCHLRPESELVSRYHCALIPHKTFPTIRDYGSKNGTFVNGHPVQGQQELKSGDKIRIGPLNFELLIEHFSKPKRFKPRDTKVIVKRKPCSGSDVEAAYLPS